MIFPSNPTLAIEPLPSLAQGSVPSILEAYNTLLPASSKTDSGTFNNVSVSHNLVRLCSCDNSQPDKFRHTEKRIIRIITIDLAKGIKHKLIQKVYPDHPFQ